MKHKFKISPEMRFKLYLMRLELELAFVNMKNACKKAENSFNNFGKAMGKFKIKDLPNE